MWKRAKKQEKGQSTEMACNAHLKFIDIIIQLRPIRNWGSAWLSSCTDPAQSTEDRPAAAATAASHAVASVSLRMMLGYSGVLSLRTPCRIHERGVGCLWCP